MPIINTSGQFVAETELETAELPNDAPLPEALPQVDRIILPFPSFSDGRAFTLAREIRARGFKGKLRAQGHITNQQLRHATACGFDEIEISDEQAERQPEAIWQRAAQSKLPSYQDRLGQTA